MDYPYAEHANNVIERYELKRKTAKDMAINHARIVVVSIAFTLTIIMGFLGIIADRVVMIWSG